MVSISVLQVHTRAEEQRESGWSYAEKPEEK